ncbi:MAG: PEP-utilizing enzyme [Chloroflexota bacterium]
MQIQSNTPVPGSFYTDVTSGEELWTAAFLDERFPQPVTPLGWSLIRGPFERLALREPLAYLGHPEAAHLPLTRLFRGHPYVNVAAFASFYRLLPDRLLPEDARRFFPGGHTALRRAARYPGSWAEPRLWAAALRTLGREAGNFSPWHNDRRWAWLREDLLAELAREEALLPAADELESLWQAVARLSGMTERLLALHRWSLTHADLWYSVLRRLARAWLGQGWQTQVAALVRGAERVSLALDAELHALAALVQAEPGAREALALARNQEELAQRLSGDAAGRQLVAQLDRFLGRYGQRSYSLDIHQPPFAAAPRQVYALILALGDWEPVKPPPTRPALCPRALRGLVLEQVRRLATRYLSLREEQRFVWQRILALQRAYFMRLGERLARRGALGTAEDVFFLTLDELDALARQGRPGLGGQLAAERRREWRALAASEASEQGTGYPAFLRGDAPLVAEAEPGWAAVLHGTPVSAGTAEGAVRIVREAGQLPTVGAGEVLVAVGVDPGWTPVFAKIAALVTESGGQLSHPAVVAREYHLPAVLAVPGATRELRTGEIVRVDGAAGTITRLSAQLNGGA